MKDIGLKKWNDRYKEKEYAYSTKPNEFLKEQIQKLKVGTILFAAEGEGRNAVYAAINNWKVSAFDISEEGKNKALRLAQKNHVSINYKVGQLPNLDFENEYFDCIALIYAHFPPEIRSKFHKLLNNKLKQDGFIILEAFGKNHLDYRNKNPKVGGPSDLESLISTEEIQSDFQNFEIIQLEEKVIELNEGLYHNGKGSVTRFVGRKIQSPPL